MNSLIEAIGRLASSEPPAAIESFADAIERGAIGVERSTAGLQACLGFPESRLSAFREVLAAATDLAVLPVALRSATAAVCGSVARHPQVSVAWTYPRDVRPGLRTTGGVSREVIVGSRHTLLVVGFSVTTDAARTGLASKTLEAIAAAAARGVAVTAVLHRDANRRAFVDAWRAGVKAPSIFTWPQASDPMASVHAKILVADRADALVTSANLTYHGFEGNLEIGLRVSGQPAADIHDRILDLIRTGDLVLWRS